MAFLVRQKARLLDTLASFLTRDRYRYIQTTCARILDVTIRENRPRLVRKFRNLRSKTQDKPVNSVDTDADTVQRRVKNLSSAELASSGLALLAKGPSFGTTQTLSKSVLLQVEKGIERFSYAKRWKNEIAECHDDSPPYDTSTTEPTSVERSRTPPSEDVTPPQQVLRQTTTHGDASQRRYGGEPADRRKTAPQDRGPFELGNKLTEDDSGETDDRDNAEDRLQRGCAPDLSLRFPDIGKISRNHPVLKQKFDCRS